MAYDTSSGSSGTAVSGSGGASSGWWEPILEIGANILGNVASAGLANDGVNKQRDAYQAATDKQLGLSRDIFNTNLQLSKPFYQGAGNAFNLLSNIYGLPAQNFSFPGMVTGGGYGNGASAANNWGAGQPVQGHTGGGGPNAFTSAIGSAAGNFFGGPIGGAIGGALGGMIRNGGDNWTTLATGAPEGFDYTSYMNQPDLQAEWSKPDVQSLFNGNRDAYAYWHYNKFGKGENRQLTPTEGYTLGTDGMPTRGGDAGGSGAGAGGTNAFGDPLQLFWASPDGQLAKNQFLTVDSPAIKGAFATSGKAISGAQQKALADRGAAMGANAFGNYRGGLERMAGMGTSASSQAQTAATNYGTMAGNAFATMGDVNANAAKDRNANWTNAFKNSVSGSYDYARGQGWL